MKLLDRLAGEEEGSQDHNRLHHQRESGEADKDKQESVVIHRRHRHDLAQGLLRTWLNTISADLCNRALSWRSRCKPLRLRPQVKNWNARTRNWPGSIQAILP